MVHPPAGLNDAQQTQFAYAGATVGILLATFNGGEHLSEQLASIAQQSYGNWTLVVSDDGSTDRTMDIISQFADAHPGRVVILPPRNQGSAKSNFLRLLRDCPSFDYYAFCDQDDYWFPEKLDGLVRTAARPDFIRHRDRPLLIHADMQVTDEHLRVTHDSFMGQIRAAPATATFGSLLIENYIPGCTMLINQALRLAYIKTAPNEDAIVMHDWWLALIACALGEIRYVDAPLASYRQHRSNTLGTVNRSGAIFAMRKVFRDAGKSIASARQQAEEFANCYSVMVPPQTSAALNAFLEMPRMSKLTRIRISVRHGILKQTIPRRVFQFLII